MNNKFSRYTIGFILFSIILLSFYFSKVALFITSIFFIIVALHEYRTMFKAKDIHIHRLIPEAIGILLSAVFIYSNNISEHVLVTPILMFGIIGSFILTIIKNKKPYILTSLCTIASILFTFCGLYIIKLTYYFEQNYAWYLILIYFIAVLSGDWVASIIGPRFKKNMLLSKEISPNKTIAGSIANLICACLSCIILHYCLDIKIQYCILLGVVISTFSQFGDLTISTFKRDLEIKHSGNLFLEYGGILDRMDAFIFSAPAAYYFLFIATII